MAMVMAGEPGHCGLGEGGIFRLALVPPIGQRALRVDVDQHHGPRARTLRLHG